MTFGPYKASVSAIHDGDTLDVDVLLRPMRVARDVDQDLGFQIHRRSGGIWLVKQSVRLKGCNAPELATAAGKTALVFLETLVKVGDPVTLTSYGWDKYGGRIDGTIQTLTGLDLTAEMIRSGNAAVWDGTGPKPVPVP